MLRDSGFLGFYYPILISISEYNVHMLIKGKKCAYHHSSILQSQPNSEVDPLQKFTSLCCHSIIFIIDLPTYNHQVNTSNHNHRNHQNITSSSSSSNRFWDSVCSWIVPSSFSFMASSYSWCFFLLSNTFFSRKKSSRACSSSSWSMYL